MADDGGQFEDAALRAALRRSLGKQTAPAELRDKLQQMLGGSTIAPARPMARWRSIMLGFSAAAVILLSVALVAVQVRNYVMNPSTPAIAPVPDALAASLMKTHDACSRLADHHLIADNDVNELSKRLNSDLGFNVIVPNMQGWVFKGVGECAVGDMKTAHVVYSSGDEALSVFALPAQASAGCGSAGYCESLVNQHAIIGFTADASVYYVVCHSTGHAMTLAELKPLADRVRGAVNGRGECHREGTAGMYYPR